MPIGVFIYIQNLPETWDDIHGDGIYEANGYNKDLKKMIETEFQVRVSSIDHTVLSHQPGSPFNHVASNFKSLSTIVYLDFNYLSDIPPHTLLSALNKRVGAEKLDEGYKPIISHYLSHEDFADMVERFPFVLEEAADEPAPNFLGRAVQHNDYCRALNVKKVFTSWFCKYDGNIRLAGIYRESEDKEGNQTFLILSPFPDHEAFFFRIWSSSDTTF